MNGYESMKFGEYIKAKRLECEKHPSLRSTATAIGVSPQFYSEVEKDRRSAFTAERLAKLKDFLELTSEDAQIMYDKAAESKKTKDTAVAQDFSDYIMEKDYVARALRVAKEMGTGEKEWLEFIAKIQNKEE